MFKQYWMYPCSLVQVHLYDLWHFSLPLRGRCLHDWILRNFSQIDPRSSDLLFPSLVAITLIAIENHILI